MNLYDLEDIKRSTSGIKVNLKVNLVDLDGLKRSSFGFSSPIGRPS